jgi:hypothetical protein
MLIRYVSENLKTTLMRLESDVCLDNDVESNEEMIKSLFINHKVING